MHVQAQLKELGRLALALQLLSAPAPAAWAPLAALLL